MKAIKSSDFEECGCAYCGCDYCYLDGMDFGNGAIVKCAECGKSFMVLADTLKISPVGFGDIENYNGFLLKEEKIKEEDSIDFLSSIDFQSKDVIEKLQNGFAIQRGDFYYPIVGNHPRKGIPKHEFVLPDIRPEDGVGDFCYPRGVGYDLACFVKSKEAGERITKMINDVSTKQEEKCFESRLDYRIDEPLWIQVKIDYTDTLRAKYLMDLIEQNHNIITEEIVQIASNIKIEYLEKKYTNKKNPTKRKKK